MRSAFATSRAMESKTARRGRDPKIARLTSRVAATPHPLHFVALSYVKLHVRFLRSSCSKRRTLACTNNEYRIFASDRTIIVSCCYTNEEIYDWKSDTRETRMIVALSSTRVMDSVDLARQAFQRITDVIVASLSFATNLETQVNRDYTHQLETRRDAIRSRPIWSVCAAFGKWSKDTSATSCRYSASRITANSYNQLTQK